MINRPHDTLTQRCFRIPDDRGQGLHLNLSLLGHPSAVTPLAHPELAMDVIIKVFDNLDKYPIKTAARFRNALLGDGMVAINPLLNIGKKEQVEALLMMLRHVVIEGRMIDFGHVPNAVLKAECLRARDSFEALEMPHPYIDWLAVSSWEGGMCGYYFAVDPADPRRVLIVETYGVSLPDKGDAILVNDIIAIEVVGPQQTRIVPFPLIDESMETVPDMETRGANVLDPLVTFLRFLSDASIPITDQPAPARLNRQRVARGTFEIPAHSRVETRDYVSMMSHHGKPSRASQGGHHASPVAHWRRAHQRHLATGKVVPVRSSKVNFRDVTELHRLFYRAKP